MTTSFQVSVWCLINAGILRQHSLYQITKIGHCTLFTVTVLLHQCPYDNAKRTPYLNYSIFGSVTVGEIGSLMWENGNAHLINRRDVY